MTYENRLDALRAPTASVLVALVGLAAFAAPAAAELPLTLTVGGKLGVGANYLSAPNDIAPNRLGGGAAFDDGVGGYGVGAGIFAEARFLDGLIGAELDMIFDSSTNMSKLEVPGRAAQEPGWTVLDLRMPLLLSLGMPGDGTRVAIGTGPEFVFPLSVEGTNGEGFGDRLAVSETHVNWAVNLGLAVPVGPVRVSFDLRFAYNLATPSTYQERILPTGALAVHEMDIRLILGVGYDILTP